MGLFSRFKKKKLATKQKAASPKKKRENTPKKATATQVKKKVVSTKKKGRKTEQAATLPSIKPESSFKSAPFSIKPQPVTLHPQKMLTAEGWRRRMLGS